MSITPETEVQDRLRSFLDRMKRQTGNARWTDDVKKMNDALARRG